MTEPSAPPPVKRTIFTTRPLLGASSACGLALVMSALGDLVFGPGRPVGWAMAAYGILAGIIIFTIAIAKKRAELADLSGSLIVLVLAIVACAVNGSRWSVFIAFFALISILVSSHKGKASSAVLWCAHMVQFHLFAWLVLLFDIVRTPKLLGSSKRNIVLRNTLIWGIAGGLSIIFIVLFSLANPLIGDFMERISAFFDHFQLSLKLVIRIILFVFISFGSLMLVRYRSPKLPLSSKFKMALPCLPASLTQACLILFNLVFAVQTILDMCYLFGGMSLPDGMTYAEYARRGFYPLWIAAMLAGLFMLFAWTDDTDKKPRTSLQNILTAAWLTQNGFLLISASYRLYLYVSAYSLTRLRVAAAVGMLLVFVGLASIAFRLCRRRSLDWLINVNAISSLTALLALLIVNTSGLIAGFNFQHCREISQAGPYLDMDYMQNLGEGAIPALIEYLRTSDYQPGREKAVQVLTKLEKNLEEKSGDWRGWTYRRSTVLKILADYASSAPGQPPADQKDSEVE